MQSRTGAVWFIALAVAVTTAGIACDNDPGVMVVVPGSYEIRTAADTVAVMPGTGKDLVFQVVDDKQRPAAGRVVQFEIPDAIAARGASVSVERGITGMDGSVQVLLIAGLSGSFKLKVSADGATPLSVLIIVSPQKRGPVEIAPVVLAPTAVATTVVQIRITFVEDTACSAVSRTKPQGNLFDPRAVPPGGTAVFLGVSTEENHAVFGQALDAGGIVRADGCVDLPGSAVLEEGLMKLTLPLSPPPVSPVGRYRATSFLALQGMPKAVAAVSQSWGELASCRFDPGRLWLDCTTDALGADTADDPLDCVPSAADEAAFAGRLTALRGLPVRDPARPAARCRQAVDGAGRPALETQVEGMFAARNPRVAENLRSLAADVAGLTASYRLHSSMVVSATTSRERYQLEHRLEAVEFTSPSEPIRVELLPLGLPVRTAPFVAMNASGTELAIDRHGFTLRLGGIMRLAVEQTVLPRRGLPSSIPEVITRTFASATYPHQGTTLTGCQALSALICPQVQGADQCVVAACDRGVAGLGKNLEQVFHLLDGKELDLFLEGFVQTIERDNDGLADALGFLLPGAGEPGVWVSQLLAGQEPVSFGGYFTADRVR